MSKWIYLVYSHEYKAGYVGKSCNLKQRYSTHCGDSRSCVKQFCIKNDIKARDRFDMYEIMKCDVTNAAYYEGRTYDLIQQYYPHIKLINKNKPNRSNKQWRKTNAERCKANNRQWYANNAERCKANNRQWYANNVERCKANHEHWREKNLAYNKQRLKTWRKNNPNYHKEYYQKRKLMNK